MKCPHSFQILGFLRRIVLSEGELEFYWAVVGAVDVVEDVGGGDTGAEVFGNQEVVYAPAYVPLAGVHAVGPPGVLGLARVQRAPHSCPRRRPRPFAPLARTSTRGRHPPTPSCMAGGEGRPGNWAYIRSPDRIPGIPVLRRGPVLGVLHHYSQFLEAIPDMIRCRL